MILGTQLLLLAHLAAACGWAQAGSPVVLTPGRTMAQLQAAAAQQPSSDSLEGVASDSGRWADSNPARPSLAVAGGFPAKESRTSGAPLHRASLAMEPPAPAAPKAVLYDGHDGLVLGMGEGFLSVERKALSCLSVRGVGKPLAAILFVILLIPALIVGLFKAARLG